LAKKGAKKRKRLRHVEGEEVGKEERGLKLMKFSARPAELWPGKIFTPLPERLVDCGTTN